MRKLRVEHLGCVKYAPMFALQRKRHREVVAGEQDDTLFLLQHSPVVTLGRNRPDVHVLLSPEELERRGIEYVVTDRGGDVTYHGPGQLVVYPILALEPQDRDIRKYVAALEEIILRTAADFGVRAQRVDGLRGIWVGSNKLAAIGVRIATWATMHGFALNVTIEPADFGVIVPCGLHDKGVATLQQLAAEAVHWQDVCAAVVQHAGEVLQRGVYAAEATPLESVAEVALEGSV